MISMNAVRIVEVARNEWEVQMRPNVRWRTPEGYECVYFDRSYENCLAFVMTLLDES